METLLEDYKRKLKTAESMLENGMTFGDEQENRIKIKASVYRSAIVDIERAMAKQQQQNSANCVSNNEVSVCDTCGSERTIILKKCGRCGNTIDIIKAD